MRRRTCKCLLLSVLVIFGAGLGISLSGCTDKPESADAKQLRSDIAAAQATVSPNADDDALRSAQNRIQSSLVKHQQANRQTKDAALLASGNLAMVRGRRMQSRLALNALPVRYAANAFERSLRAAEEMLLEKERLQGLLDAGTQEMAQLQQLISGSDRQSGLQAQLEAVQTELTQLQNEKDRQQTQKDNMQNVLDDFQAQADDLLRKAELSQGDQRLTLEKQAYSILQNRKDHYIKAQAAEDQITMFDGQIELVQLQVDHLQQSIRETNQRIQAIQTSDTRSGLQRQLREIEQSLGLQQQQLTGLANTVAEELKAFHNEAKAVCDVFEEAAGEFGNISSPGASFTADLQRAESCHHAAQACAAALQVGNDLSMRLEDLLKTTDPAFANRLSGQLPIAAGVDTRLAETAMDFFDKAIEAYQKAYDAAGRLGPEAQSDVLKSQLLTVDGKIQLAELLIMPAVADAALAQRQELIKKGQEFGVSFTQSETLKLVEFGINYRPSLPVNLSVLAEQLGAEFNAWKRLPLDQQEAAVEANLARIDQLIAQYGQTLAEKLEPYRQEMLAARQRGFDEPQSGAASGPGDPNNF